MDELILVVYVVDLAYKKPKVNIAYAGSNMSKAYSAYNKQVVSSDRTQVSLQLVQNGTARELEFSDSTVY